jgi:hypothetical protein
MPPLKKNPSRSSSAPGPPPKRGPLWKGPEADGVTFSMLSRFLSCRERFRVHYLDGIKPADRFNHRMEYGQMWHACEEALAAGLDWEAALAGYAASLNGRYPLSQEQVEHWYNVCRVQFPAYVYYWREQPDVLRRTPVEQERVFDVPYQLPSGRVVRLRGKRDAADLIKDGRNRLYVQENKTKSDIDESQLKRQLTSDLQTMLYLVSVKLSPYDVDPEVRKTTGAAVLKYGIGGVRYNVVRRPLSGGKGSIVRHKPTKSNPLGESADAYYSRLRGIIDADPGYFFMRWKVEVQPTDVDAFRRRTLDPVLEQLCDWYEFVTTGDPWRQEPLNHGDMGAACGVGYGTHWQHPHGSINWLDEGGASDLDEYLATGSMAGLVRTDKLFEELT